MSSLEEYDYDLPKQLIAQNPLARRADARLMVLQRRRNAIDHFHIRDLPELLTAGDCLVLNDTRVVQARLVGHRQQTGGRWEGLFLEAMPEGLWRVIGKTRGALRPGEKIILADPQGRDSLALVMAARAAEGQWIARPESDEDALALLDRFGRVPLPPYIRKGEMLRADRENYQTVYARNPGAVAAPTAGLHFTEALLERLAAAGIDRAWLTLHVGLGTFRPITAESLDGHRMHAEWADLPAASVEKILACRRGGGRVVAVGTTAVRVLETAARDGTLKPFRGQTDLFVRPPFTFHAVDAMLTNFHLPRTTLLVLVQAFGGGDLVRRAYAEAISEQYRFYSYGDAMLIL